MRASADWEGEASAWQFLHQLPVSQCLPPRALKPHTVLHALVPAAVPGCTSSPIPPACPLPDLPNNFCDTRATLPVFQSCTGVLHLFSNVSGGLVLGWRGRQPMCSVYPLHLTSWLPEAHREASGISSVSELQSTCRIMSGTRVHPAKQTFTSPSLGLWSLPRSEVLCSWPSLGGLRGLKRQMQVHLEAHSKGREFSVSRPWSLGLSLTNSRLSLPPPQGRLQRPAVRAD